jgi:HEAT repeat protein
MKLLSILLLSPLLIAQPRVQNAQAETRAVTGTLTAAINAIAARETSPLWIGYAVPEVAGERNQCCWNNGISGCGLEPVPFGQTVQMPAGTTVRLEPAGEFHILVRVGNKQIEKIRTYSVDCGLDAGGLKFIWLTGVNPGQSIEFLESQSPTNNLVSAIGLHRDPAADAALDRLSAPTRPEEIRRQAAYALGAYRGRHGYESVARILRDDTNDRVREQAIFALTVSKEADAIPLVVKTAREDKSARVRGQALFWLAQRATKAISETALRQAIEQDPEMEVKRRAISGLGQMPNAEGVPILIDVAKNNKNPEVRRQAMQTLGQSKDPRAVSFFETVLSSK